MTLDHFHTIQRREFLKTRGGHSSRSHAHSFCPGGGGRVSFLSTPAESVRLAAGHLDATAETVASAIQAAIGRPIQLQPVHKPAKMSQALQAA